MKKLNNKIKGFTLIELLVVIAIIGLLAAMVLVAVSTARTKAKDARVKAGVQQIRVLAEASASDSGSYSLVSGTSPFNTLAADISSQGGTFTQNTNGASGSATSWCGESLLPSAPTTFFCLDTLGNSGVNTGARCATGSTTDGSCGS